MKTLLFYRISAWSLITAVIMALALDLVVILKGPEAVNDLPIGFKLPISFVGAVGTLGLFALWPGMIWHCLVVSTASLGRKIAWLLFLLLTIPIAALLYYFNVFVESQQAKGTGVPLSSAGR